MGKLFRPEFLAGLDKNPEYTRAGVYRLYCISIKAVGLSDEEHLQFKPYPIPKHFNVQ